MIFISHSHTDDAFVDMLSARLHEHGYITWVDHMDIPGGQHWDDVVEQQLNAADLLLLVLTPAAIASQEVKAEWSYFRDKKKAIVPVLLAACEPPLRLRMLQFIDFTQGQVDERAFKQLLKSLPKPPPPTDLDATQMIRQTSTLELVYLYEELQRMLIKPIHARRLEELQPGQLLFAFPKLDKIGIFRATKEKLYIGWQPRGSEGGARPEIDLGDFDAPANGVSRQHALIERSRQGLLIQDLGSTNGTVLDGKPLALLSPQPLKSKAILRFGMLIAQVFYRE